ncbi:MAG: endonuclease/exonuclease/phosphatase family protein [Candidatus Coproplasma sp.]
MTKRIIKNIAIGLAVVFALILLTVLGYVVYVAVQYYRIEDNQILTTSQNSSQKLEVGQEYSVVSYNVGFGAYSPEYSFFMDEGVMLDGTVTGGIYAKGMSKDDVEKNVTGQVNTLQELNADFCLLQEADESAHRSYNINMVERFSQLSGYSSTYACNFHTANLFYPFNDPIGIINGGIQTLSRYNIQSSVRRSFPVTTDFIDKFFDLDRCFTMHYLPVEGSEKMLVLMNVHMSAYDEGGKIRAQQLEMLNTVLAAEYAAGNYVIAGGDFNHCLIADQFDSVEEALEYYQTETGQQIPDWVKTSILHNDELASGFRVVASIDGAATCRGADMPYEKGVNYETVIDGFLVSDNVEVVWEGTIDTGYAYSDHNPVKMTFKLKTV